jgi:hypothetical protein
MAHKKVCDAIVKYLSATTELWFFFESSCIHCSPQRPVIVATCIQKKPTHPLIDEHTMKIVRQKCWVAGRTPASRLTNGGMRVIGSNSFSCDWRVPKKPSPNGSVDRVGRHRNCAHAMRSDPANQSYRAAITARSA